MSAGTIHKLETWTGRPLRARDGEIGTLREVYFDDAQWVVRYFVVRTGRWLLGRDVLVAPELVTHSADETHLLDVDLSREQIEGCPLVDTRKPVSRHYEELYHRYYHLQPYWRGGLPAWPGEPIVLPPREAVEPERPHLRSSDEVTGYRIHAADGKVGHVADLLICDRDWRVRFLEVDTRNWWPGRHVLIAPAWIERVVWADREVFVTVTREAIESAPEYDPKRGIGSDDELRLFEHYGAARRLHRPDDSKGGPEE